jgi:hypothetical protein
MINQESIKFMLKIRKAADNVAAKEKEYYAAHKELNILHKEHLEYCKANDICPICHLQNAECKGDHIITAGAK